jgi:hypothetical protein
MKFTESCRAVSPTTGIVKDFTIEYNIVKNSIKSIIGINGADPLVKGDRIETLELPNSCNNIPIRGIDADVFGHSYNPEYGDSFCIGPDHPIGTLIIPEGIQFVRECAFSHLVADKVIWPSTCGFIPTCCFSDSTISEIVGMEKVYSIQERAFSKVKGLKEFNWPKDAKSIPAQCFDSCCSLENINGIEDVETIGRAAFSGTSLKRFIWPEHCDTVPDRCFEASDLEEIVFPGTVVSVGHLCLTNTKVKEINLENSFRCDIDESVEKQGIKVIESFYRT